MNKKLVVRQNGNKDCAVACLVSIMRYYGVYPLYEEVSYLIRLNKEGTNAYNIINGSRTLGFDGYGVHYSASEICDGKVLFPLICHTIKNNMYHFIVVYQVKKNKILVMDPSSNKKYLSKEAFESIYQGTSIVVYPVKKINNIQKHQSLYSFIFDYLKTQKSRLFKVIMLSIVVIILSFITSFYLRYFINNEYSYNTLLLLTILFIVLNIFKDAIFYIRDNMLSLVENNLSSYINTTIFRKLFNLPYLFFKNKSTSEVISRIDDLSSFRRILSSILVNTCINIIFIICSFIILLSINYKLLLVCLFELILYLLVTLLFKNKLDSLTEELLISNSEYKQSVSDSINGYESNKNINRISSIIKKLEIRYLSFNNKYYYYNKSNNIECLIKNIINDTMYLIELFMAFLFVKKGLMLLGDLVLFNTILIYFINPIKSIFDQNHDLIYLKNTYKRINDLFMTESIKELEKEYKLYSDIVIDNLSYSIDGVNNIFSNVNLRIKYKSKYLIYGASGSGKSTLCKILLKYLNDYNGSILFDNINLKDISSNVISYNFTYVSQNSYLNNDTFKNNIIYDRNISVNNYEKVISICNLESLRNSKALRNNFMIEDNGFNISGGQRQKVILARSLLKESNYLILDEALSEVDINEEIDILKKVFYEFKEKTIIYISHKKELIKYFNDKYKLERSKEVWIKKSFS